MLMLSEKTFESIGFRDYPKGEDAKYVVTWHPDLKRMAEYRDSVVTAICEFIVGMLDSKSPPRPRNKDVMLDIPPDVAGQHGCFDVQIDHEKKSVFVKNLFTSRQPIDYI